MFDLDSGVKHQNDGKKRKHQNDGKERESGMTEKKKRRNDKYKKYPGM